MAAAMPAAPSTAPSAAPDTNALQPSLGDELPEALAKGKVSLDVRARVESANETGLKAVKKASIAPTIRTRLGFTTAPLYGFQAMAEGQNTALIGPEGNYNAAGSDHRAYKPVIGDPPVTDLDQAWIKYVYTNMFDIKAGRQALDLDNQRFVGEVDWRQNIQTFDALTAHAAPIDALDLTYSYLWDVHRVYGNVSGLSTTNQDFHSDSHLINLDYSGWKYGRFVGYAYLLDLKNGAGANNSAATYGGYFAGNAPVAEKLSLDYRAEAASQENYGDSTLRYSANYVNLEGGAKWEILAAGAGWEDLGSGANTGKGGGRAAFRTPLATLHPFNGFAEMFLTGPSAGLRDLYFYAQITLPEEIPVRVIYHKFDSDFGHGDYGQEVDCVATKNFGKHWQVLLENAYYMRRPTPPPRPSPPPT